MCKTVKLPGQRASLIWQIKDLSDFEMQKEKWVDSTHPCRFSAKMTYPIDVLLEEGDLDVEKSAKAKISYWMRNRFPIPSPIH